MATKAGLQEVQDCWSGVWLQKRRDRARAENTKSKWLLEQRIQGQNQESEITAQLTHANNKQPKATNGLNLTPIWMQQITQRF